MKACCKTSETLETRKKRVPVMLIVIGALVALAVAVVVSDKAFALVVQDAGSQSAMPASYAAAIQAIDVRMANIARLIDAKQLDSVHAEAEVIRDVAKILAQLALKADSGVPREAVKEINVAAKSLADTFEAIDEAGDSGNVEATKKVYQQMAGLQGTLKKYVAEAYQCPMKCEGDKTYAKPGDCPKCGMHLKRLAGDKYTVDVKPAAALQAGTSASLTITIKDPRGKTVTALENVHETFLHLLVVSKDLSWFSHEHPQMQADGTFTLSLMFPAPGDYVLYHDFTPPAVGQQVVQVPLTVPGQAPASVALVVDSGSVKQVDGYTVKFSTKTPLVAEDEAELVFEITKDGKPVTDLQPYLGAMGHLVIISQDLKTFVHSHPHSEGEEAEDAHNGDGKGGGHHDGDGEKAVSVAATGPDVHFHAHFEAAGLYKAWGQFQHMGKVLTVPVVMQVNAGGATPAKDSGGHGH